MTAPTEPEPIPEAPRSRWSRTVGGEGEDQRAAFSELAESYWYCAYAWWRRAGLDAAQSATATLGSFTHWHGEARPGASDSGAGRMREWLPERLAELAQSGVTLEGAATITIDPEWAESRYADEPPGEPDAIFQRRWAITVIEFTASILEGEYAARREQELYAELLPFAGSEAGEEDRYAAAAERTGRSTGAMRKAVFEFRSRQSEILREFVADTVLEPADADSEMTALLCACDAPGAEAAAAPLPAAIQTMRPDEVFARAMKSVRMSQSGAGGWQPPTIREAARLFPQYEVLSLLGRGGMGAVYKARQIELDRLIAIKLLPLEVSVDKEFAERFRREARAMAKLSHPNIIAVHEFGATSEGHLFFAMEFVEGGNLHEVIHGAGLSPAHALEIIGGVCDALSFAHGKGIVHRDIKPANVMVSLDRQVKVADFGLARLTEPDVQQAATHTVTGMVMGTPEYMAPEQRRGMNVDHRADIYSVGVMLYETLCREVPQGVFDPPSVRVRGVDARVDQIVNKAMQQQPDRRYQSTAEMKADVIAVGARLPARAGALAEEKRRGAPVFAWLAGAVAVLVAIAALAHFALWKKNGTAAGSSGRAASHEAAGQSGSIPSKATKEKPFVNTLDMKFVPVPGTQALFSVWDTRVKDYGAYARANKVDDSWKNQEKDGVPISRQLDYPVVAVSWEDANGFCKWLTEKENAEGKLPTGMAYRLPTDEEWSRAVGLAKEEGATPAEKSGKNAVDFPWGKEWPPTKKVGNYADEAFHAKFPLVKNEKENAVGNQWIEGYTDGYATTSPVGSFPSNAYGLHDMAGNVWQWCEDWFDASHKERVLRGASWGDFNRDDLLSSHRALSVPGRRRVSYGFRCVLAPAPASMSAQATPVASAASPQTSNGIAVSPESATKDQPFVNALGMKFAPVPIIGGPTAGQSVLFSVWDTRVEDYETYVNDTKRRWPKTDFPQGPTHPAVMVNWDDAQAFCEWLQAREQAAGRLPAGWGYRLPSDLEWSCAVGLEAEEGQTPAERSDKNQVEFPWGRDFPPSKAVGNYAEQIYADGYVNTSPVGSFPANRYGLQDMGGNVWQWCGGWIDASHTYRVLRGASWSDHDRSTLLSSHRLHNTDQHSYSPLVGFRCVLASSSTPPTAAAPQPSSPSASTPTATPKPPSEIEKWFAQIDPPQEEAFQKQVLKPFETGVAELRTRYRTALDARLTRASAANQLDEALAWRAEKQAFEKAQNVASDDPGAPPVVKTLRAEFRQQFAQLDQDRAARARILHAQYDTTLAQTQTLLTQRSRLDDALFLKAKRDEIARAWLGPAPFVTVGADGRPEAAKPGSVQGATKDQPFVNSLDMKFVPVPGTQALFGVWDTRVKDYAAFARARKVDEAWMKQQRGGVPASREPDYPVAGVSWDDANAFCQWLTEKENAEGKLPKGMAYRLPTDEEWSRAVGLAKEDGATPKERSGKNQAKFPWGTEYPPKANVGNYADAAYHEKFPTAPWLEGYADGFAMTSPVGSFPPNEYGLYDMGGNVWQWCQDLYEPGKPERALRGASYDNGDRGSLLSSARFRNTPNTRHSARGFRCVLDVSGR